MQYLILFLFTISCGAAGGLVNGLIGGNECGGTDEKGGKLVETAASIDAGGEGLELASETESEGEFLESELLESEEELEDGALALKKNKDKGGKGDSDVSVKCVSTQDAKDGKDKKKGK